MISMTPKNVLSKIIYPIGMILMMMAIVLLIIQINNDPIVRDRDIIIIILLTISLSIIILYYAFVVNTQTTPVVDNISAFGKRLFGKRFGKK